MEQRRKECDFEFNRIWERLSTGDHTFDTIRDCSNTLDRRVTVLETNMLNLIKSMGKLTSAIWGAVLAVAGVGVTFIIWYIQSIK